MYRSSQRNNSTLTRNFVLSVLKPHLAEQYVSYDTKDMVEKELMERKLKRRIKAVDALYNPPFNFGNLFLPPKLLVPVLQGTQINQRISNKIVLSKLQYTIQVDYSSTNLLDPVTLTEISAPTIFFRWAIIYFCNSQDPTLTFNSVFKNLDFQGDAPTHPNTPTSSIMDTFSYPEAGNSAQGYQKHFFILRSGFFEVSGVNSTQPNGNFKSDTGVISGVNDPRYTFNDSYVTNETVDLLNLDYLNSIGSDDLLTTCFDAINVNASVSSVKTGSVYFLIGGTYPDPTETNIVLDVGPSITFKSRIYYFDS